MRRSVLVGGVLRDRRVMEADHKSAGLCPGMCAPSLGSCIERMHVVIAAAFKTHTASGGVAVSACLRLVHLSCMFGMFRNVLPGV